MGEGLCFRQLVTMTDEQLPVVRDGDTEQYIRVTPAEDDLQPETC